ncbi:MAG: DUF1559 domain-containing protein [Planctomycetaceae bacterium]
MSFAPVDYAGAAPKSNRTLIVVVIACGIGAVLVAVTTIGFVLPAIRNARALDRSLVCKRNLRQIGRALHSYHIKHKSFPPAYAADENGKPMHSWRVLILPFLGHQKLFDRYRMNEPWDSPHNRSLAAEMPDVFRCPSFSDDSPMTHYVTVRSAETMFPGAEPVRIRDITDGTSNTLCVVSHRARAVHWMSPEDVSPDEFVRSLRRNDGPGHSGGTHVLTADGAVRFFYADTTEKRLRELLTRAGGEGDCCY